MTQIELFSELEQEALEQRETYPEDEFDKEKEEKLEDDSD